MMVNYLNNYRLAVSLVQIVRFVVTVLLVVGLLPNDTTIVHHIGSPSSSPSSSSSSSISFVIFVQSLDNGVALTPPMGWLSWERYGCQIDCNTYPDTCISQNLYLSQAQLLLDHGYHNVGYQYIDIDDCWTNLERDPISHKLVADPIRFPNGMKYLSDQLHNMGFKIGLYGDIGNHTCGGYPGFNNHFELDITTLAKEYEIDSLKVDTCFANEDLFNITYPAFGQLLNKTGRPILFSCSWPNDYYERHHHYENPDYLNYGIKQTCNTWRNYFDVYDSWSESVMKIIDFWARSSPEDVMVRAAGPGHWNDPDMLMIGNPGLSISEQQSQFSLWSIFAAPLYISADLRTMPEESRAILLNEEIIAVNQDPLGRQGWCADDNKTDFTRVWVRELIPSTTSTTMTMMTTKTTFSSNRNNTINNDNDNTTNDSSTSRPLGSSNTWAVVLQNYRPLFNAKLITFDPKLHLPSTAWMDYVAYRHESGMANDINNNYDTNNTTKSTIRFSVRDLTLKQDLGIYTNVFTARIDESSVGTYRIVLLLPTTTTTILETKTKHKK